VFYLTLGKTNFWQRYLIKNESLRSGPACRLLVTGNIAYRCVCVPLVGSLVPILSRSPEVSSLGSLSKLIYACFDMAGPAR
jgi:hypothetical protein